MFTNEVESIVLSYPKLKERLDAKQDKPKAYNDERAKIIKNLNEIKADYSKAYISSLRKILDASLPKLYDGINFNAGEVDFPKLVQESCVVMVPNHQSHADYLAINYMVYKTYGLPLYVAGGKNLNIFPIGTIFRKSGCFFIRRSFQNDIVYKLTLEAYLYYLLKTGKPIEFFFEGGRSRTGKLRPPRFGLYQMLLETHATLKEEGDKRPLVFVPVSIVHEYVPEQKSLTKELDGSQKQQENTRQLFGLVKLFAYQFGNVHINLGHPVEAKFRRAKDDLRSSTHDLAFECFREVGKNMLVTPTSLLALILLDEPSKALNWQDILSRSKAIIRYCKRFNIPITESLEESKLEASLGRSIDIMIGNKKIDAIGRNQDSFVYYSIKKECRGELLYFKNMILHHFLVPWAINGAWINLFNGEINSVADLKDYFLNQRGQLIHEFYLPTVKQFFRQTLEVVSDAIGRPVNSLGDCMKLSHKELYAIVSHLGIFARAVNYINEVYYACAQAIKQLAKEKKSFSVDAFQNLSHSIFKEELALGRVIIYPESYSLPLVKNALKYFVHQKLVTQNQNDLELVNHEAFELLVQKYEKHLVDQLKFSIRPY